MKVAYLILAHKNFEQLHNLVSQLNHPDVSFILHIDGKVEKDSYAEILKFDSNVDIHFLEDRCSIYWGGFSVFKAVFYLIAKALDHNKYDYISLLSGEDFPIKPNDHIISELSKNNGKEFLSYHEIPHVNWPGRGGLDRIDFFWLLDEIGLTHSREFARNQFLMKSYRAFPEGLTPFGGSMWFTITTGAAKYIYQYIVSNPSTLAFFKYTLIPDEIVIQSILVNSPFRENIINDNLRFIIWKDNQEHPETLTSQYYKQIAESEALFARKFDTRIDGEIIEKIRLHLL